MHVLYTFRKCPGFVALVNLPKFSTGRHQASSANEMFLLEL